MQPMNLATRQVDLVRFSSANLTTTGAFGSLASLVYALTSSGARIPPTGGISTAINIDGGICCATLLELMPYGVGSAAQVGHIQVIGFNANTELDKWFPKELAVIDVTLSAIEWTSTQKTANTLAVAVGEDGDNIIVSTRAAGFAWANIDLQGCPYFTLRFNKDGITTSMNALYGLK